MTKPHRHVLLSVGLALAMTTGVHPASAQRRGPRKPKVEKPVVKKPALPRAEGKKAAEPAHDAAPSAGKHGGAKPLELAIPVQKVKLDNGLRVVINVDRTSPTVAIAVTYDVGSRNEERGRSGFAHLFEHMMFQGSANVSKGDHFRLISGHGGTLNGTTNADRTNYYEVLPANELALGLWLEADRMRSLDVSKDNFENQRKVVQEEYRMRVSNAAYQPSAIRLEELVYQGYWPYEHSTIGSMADLDGAQLDWVRAFHAHHYGPNNAVLSIAGDIDPAEAVALAHQYFDPIARVAAPPFAEASLPEQTSQRTAIVRDDNARTPGVLVGFAIPAAQHPDRYALEIAAILLADGESSRLHQLMVRDKAVAQRVGAGAWSRRGPGIFRVDTVLTAGAKPADAERMIEAEIKSLATRGPSDAEVEKARRQVEAGLVLGLQSNLARARRLGEYELYWGDAGLVSGEVAKYFAVTRDDVKRVADKYLGPTRRTVVETLPVEKDGDKPDPSAKKAKHEAKRPDAQPGAQPGAKRPDAQPGAKRQDGQPGAKRPDAQPGAKRPAGKGKKKR